MTSFDRDDVSNFLGNYLDHLEGVDLGSDHPFACAWHTNWQDEATVVMRENRGDFAHIEDADMSAFMSAVEALATQRGLVTGVPDAEDED